MDHRDDLAAVDALQVDRRDAEVGMAELTLDDVERYALPRHLDGVRMAKLVRSEAATNTGASAQPAEVRTDCALRPRPPDRRPRDDAEERPDGERLAGNQPWPHLLPAPVVHPGLTSLVAFPVANEHGPARRIKIRLDKRECLADSQARAPEHDDESA